MFRLFLGACLAAIVGYTSVTIVRHGWNLMPVFFGDMAAMTWPGQFNLDFFTFLLLSALWVSWRNRFSIGGLVLGVFAVLGGMLFLSIYLLVLSYRTRGDIEAMFFGAQERGQGPSLFP